MTVTKLYHVDISGIRRKLHIDGKALASGADGTIHHVKDNPELIAKRYHDPDKDPLRLQKIQAMLEESPHLPDIYHREYRYVQIAWPLGWLEEPNGRFVGYVMPKVDMSKAVSLEVLITKKTRQLAGLPESWGFRVSVSNNLASIIAELHRHGHHVIDLKPINLNVYTDHFYIAVLDCDGFSVKGKDGRRYSAHQYSDGYIAPEAMQKMLHPNQLGEEQDRFALAVILFQLMNQGLHPYQGVPVKGIQLPNTNSERIKQKLYAYGIKPNRRISPSPWSIHKYLDDETRILFDRAFTSISDRPSAAEWNEHLKPYAQADPAVVGKCKKNSMHVTFSKGCPWCELEKQTASASKKNNPKKRPSSNRQKRHKATFKRTHTPGLAHTPPQALHGIPGRANKNAPSTRSTSLDVYGIFLVIIIVAVMLLKGINDISHVNHDKSNYSTKYSYPEFGQTTLHQNERFNPHEPLEEKKHIESYLFETAIRRSMGNEIKEYILKGADVNAIGSDGQSMLNIAISSNASEIVSMLLSAGADANLIDKYGDTPLSLAASSNKISIVKLLHSYGAQVYYMYPQIYQEVLLNSELTLEQKLIQTQYPLQTLQREFLQRGISGEAQDLLVSLLIDELGNKYSWNNLMSAVANQDLKKMLINRSYANVQYRANNGINAFDLAVITGRLDMAQLLLPTLNGYPDGFHLHAEANNWTIPVELGDGRIISEIQDTTISQLSNSNNEKDKLALAYIYAMQPTANNNVTNSINILSQLAHSGNPRAAFDLAWCYSRGFGLNVNIQKANRLFDSASSGGVVEAAFWKQLFFLLYADNSNVTEVFNKIMGFADNGDKFAQYVAGAKLLLYGKKMINKKAGLTYLKQSVKNGYPAAAFALDAYYRVHSNPRNLAEADVWRKRGRELTRTFLSETSGNYDYFQFIEHAIVLQGELQAQFDRLIEAGGGPREELSFIKKGAVYLYNGNMQ